MKRVDDQPVHTGGNELTTADVFILIAGFKYGPIAHQHPELSLPELDFEIAGELGLPRLVFLLDESVVGPASMFIDPVGGSRQLGFRRRLAGTVLTASVSSPEQLEQAVLQSLLSLPKPSSSRRVWNVPPRNPNFVGRTDILNQMSIIGGTSVLVGPAGVGKSQIALEYAYRNFDRYDVTWWIPSTSSRAVEAALGDLAVALGLCKKPDKLDVGALRKYLLSSHNWLIIFDDASRPDLIRDFILIGGDVLVTADHWDSLDPGVIIKVPPFARSESVELLSSRHSWIDKRGASLIARAVDDLPLAVVMSSDLLRNSGATADELLRDLSEDVQKTIGHPHGGQLRASVRVLVDLVLKDLAKEDRAAPQLLEFAAWLSPQSIPLGILASHAEFFPAPLGRAVKDPLRIAQLTDAITVRALGVAAPRALTIQPLIADELRRRTEGHEPMVGGWPAIAVRVFRAAMPSDPTESAVTRRLWGNLLEHVLTVTDDRRRLDVVSDEVAWLLDRAAQYFEYIGDFVQAREIQRRATRRLQAKTFSQGVRMLTRLREQFEMAAELYGRDSSDALAAASDLALALQEQGQYSEALNLYRDIAGRRRKTLGPSHPDTLASTNDLALALQDIGRYKEAAALHEEVVSITRATHGMDAPGTLTAMINLSSAYRELEEYQKARVLDSKILEGFEVTLGDHHPRTLLAKMSLAADLTGLGDHAAAQAINLDVVDDYERLLGSDHPDTLVATTNLAANCFALGDYQTALELDEGVLRRSERVLGPDHPDTLRASNNLAADLRAVGEYEAAKQLSQDVVEGYTRVLGSDHPDTLRALSNLAADLRAVGEYEAAKQLSQDVVEGYTRVLGSDHPDTLRALSNLAADLRAVGENEAAKQLSQDVVEGYTRVLGSDHPDTLRALSNLAADLRAVGENEAAKQVENLISSYGSANIQHIRPAVRGRR
ncbi:tetratricopeptide repeat protein [Lentzea chajnantorensis]